MNQRPLAAIDIGTNSFHMVVARVDEIGEGAGARGPAFEVIEREKQMVRLGAGSGDMKRLEPEAIDRGVDALIRLSRIAAIHGADIHAVATSAVREAENADEFIERARLEAGVEVDVIAGVEEARLIHLGVLQSVPVFDRRLLLIDIGGGSTEILVGERGETLAAESLKLGAIRLTRRFFRGDRKHPASVESCRRHIRSALAPAVREVEPLGFEVAIASSGTAETVASLVHARRGGEPLRTYNRFEMTAEEIGEVVDDLSACATVEQRRRLPGMDPSRADIILGGALVLEQAVQEFGIDIITISDCALREGVLLDALSRRRGATLHHLQDLRRRSVVHLLETMDEDPGHSEQAAALTLELFDGLAPLHGLGDDARELLEAAALLANVGLSVSHSEHHKHSYYVIRHTDRLAGFTDHEIELIALVARYHRKSSPKVKHPEFARLRPEEQDRVRSMAAILRLGIALDRSHRAPVAGLDVLLPDDGRVIIEVTPAGDPSLELQAAEERRGLLEEVLGRDITIRAR
ncbi:MAG: Ppx/GppA family phosphatase [Acidobacteria bacterium]|nr:Ppx/GppA family phosphatase [Acidobacteriota bacterium]